MGRYDSSDAEDILNVYLHSYDGPQGTVMSLICGQESRDRPGLDRTTVRGDTLNWCVRRTGQVSLWETSVSLQI